MKTTRNKLISWMLMLVMAISLISPGAALDVNAETAYDGYVYVTMERSTVGQGFAEEPMKVGYYETESVEDIVKRAYGDSIIFTESSWGAYMTGFKDGGEPEGWTIDDIPAKIRESLGSTLTADAKRADATTLSSYDYVSSSGYTFLVDNVSANYGMSGIKYSKEEVADTYHDGSVIRVQFTMYYGDTNIATSEWGAPIIDFADKDDLISQVADFTGNKSSSVYKNAIKALEDWDATQSEITSAGEKLTEESKKPKTTSLKKVTSPKKKQIKVTWKKRSNVTGYQIQVSTSSKFKASKTKTYKVKGANVTKKTIKKSLKSKKKYYVRIRTYKTTKTRTDKCVTLKTRYSAWSSKMTVKVK